MKHLEHKTQEILKAQGFSAEGRPFNPQPEHKERLGSYLSEEIIEKAHQSDQLPEALLSLMKGNPVPYENPDQSVNISVDDVGVKQQKEERCPSEDSQLDSEPKQRHHTYQTVVHVENHTGSYVFNALGTVAALPILIAFLLHNELLPLNLQFFVDGQRSLHSAILNTFSWFGPLQLILDWYHLEEKCKKQLSLALKGRKVRNEVLTQLLCWLWHGLVDSAAEYLDSVNSVDIKDHNALEQLQGYLHRNQPYIPCYSVRKTLGLRNSSNRGEKCNDLLVSDRQKHNGMSWSKDGSVRLAAITALVRNREHLNWFEMGNIDFKLVPAYEI